MTNSIAFAGVGLGSALLTWIIVRALIRLAPRVGLVDRPNERSLHTRVTPRGGGAGFVLVFLGAALLWAGFHPQSGLSGSGWTVFLGAAGLVALVSLRDDFVSVGAAWRFLCHASGALAVTWVIGPMREIGVPLVGVIHLGPGGEILTVLWIVGLTNVYNFMDGIDGIAGAQGVIAGIAWAAVGAVFGSPTLIWLGLCLAGGCVGFLAHNWSPARIFMGDVGSAFLGFCFAVLPLLAQRSAGELASANLPGFGVLVVWPFVADGVLTFLRRAWQFEAVWKAHRSHLYQKLVRSGLSHAQVSGLYAGWSAASAGAGILWLLGVPAAEVVAALLPLVTLIGVSLLTVRREQAVVRRA